jgi:hypothetical protein
MTRKANLIQFHGRIFLQLEYFNFSTVKRTEGLYKSLIFDQVNEMMAGRPSLSWGMGWVSNGGE